MNLHFNLEAKDMTKQQSHKNEMQAMDVLSRYLCLTTSSCDMINSKNKA